MSFYSFIIAGSGGNAASPNQVHALAQTLAERGHKVVQIFDGRAYHLEQHAGNPATYTWPSRRPTRLRDARFLLRLIREHEPHCLVANFGSVNWMMSVGWLTRVPCRVAWYRTLSSQTSLDSKKARLKQNLQVARKKWVYTRASHLIANSNATKTDLVRIFSISPDKVKVLPNVLADKLVSLIPASKRQATIVCAGRLEPSKGQDILIRAVSQLQPYVHSTKLVFLGDGSEMARLEALAHDLGIYDTCIFRGRVGHDTVLEEMSTAMVTVVPSRSEAFGFVNIESLSVGTPVVASRVGGIPEIIRDGVDGFLVTPDDPEELAEKLKILLTNPTLHEKMARQARERFLEEFELQRNIQKQADWLEKIIAPHIEFPT